MRIFLLTLILPSLLLLGACGGGGGGDDAPAVVVSEVAVNNNTPPEYTAPVVTEVDEAPVETVVETTPAESTPIESTPVEESPNDPTEEAKTEFASTALLEVPGDYDWKMEFSLPIQVSLEQNKKAFLSVCTDYSFVDDSYHVNYESCILRTSVINSFNGALSISNDRKKLIAVVWYLDPAIPPHFKEWFADNNIDLPFLMSAF